ncbi:MAG TPA: hypothetical protein VE360_10590 [Pyrinomonadaceae bacterium]|jgi:hypothetical protein|nr:hypothetical protein [Pyrinomonadaceae bacterium]
MRYLSFAPALALCLLYAQCGGGPPADTARRNSNADAPAANTAPAANASVPPVASSHGGGTANAGGSPAPGAAAAPDKPPVATPELDEKIEKAEAKARAAGASAADKQAAAAARMARGNFYYSAQDTRLYRYALGDFRRALRYEPDNAEAKEKIEMIESIYRSLGRPIPTNGLEP